MDRSRNRVWLTRLSIALMALLIVSLGGRGIWLYLTSASDSDTRSTSTTISLDPSKTNDSPHPLDAVLQLARTALQAHRQRDHDYEAIISKQERIAGKLQPKGRMELKLRYGKTEGNSSTIQPRTLSVYLKFLEPKAQAGREVIWVEGQNKNQLIAHEAGMLNLLRATLAPSSSLAMMGNKYPITEIGIEKLLIRLIEKGERDRERGPCEVRMSDKGQVAGRDCTWIEVIHPKRIVEWKGKSIEHEFYRAKIAIDDELQLPIHYESSMWPLEEGGEPLLDEVFTYSDLKLNCELTDADFDPDNPAYKYP